MRAARSLSILLLLQRRGRLSASTLAGLLEVSVRTVHRDIERLGAAGVPVYAIRGKDGGYELLDGWRTNLTGLTNAEAEALFLAGVPGLARALGLGTQLISAELKVSASLVRSDIADPLRVRSRFHVDPTRWFADDDATPSLAVLSEATWNDQLVRIRYRSWTSTSTRVVAPLGIVVKAGSWYLVAEHAKRVRTFRISEVLAATTTGQRFSRPATFDLETFWSMHTERYEQSRYTTTAQIRATSAGLARLRRSANIVADTIDAAHASIGPDGWTELVIPIEDNHETDTTLLSPDIEVLAPAQLRARMHHLCTQIAQRYEYAPTPPGRRATALKNM
jgi:predicted DNA-binding transcriptional regulator YafY